LNMLVYARAIKSGPRLMMIPINPFAPSAHIIHNRFKVTRPISYLKDFKMNNV